MPVLLVEDDVNIAKLVTAGLENEGYDVEIATNGDQAVALASSRSYDLILMDLMLPGKDGLTAIKEIREKGLQTPILCITAKDSVEDLVAGFDLGSDGYLVKPFALAELLARAKALIRRGQMAKGAELHYSAVRLDPVKRQVWREEKELDLTPKEFGLLECFMRNPEQVLTRGMIAEEVWDYSFDSFTNIIDVYVNYLRNKLDRGFERPLIHTVRGVGYVLREAD